ncbi:MAG: hypothetical protein H7247_12405 [Polaromonas sp.]|nr:hypothetical protein [Gemmatimonadaceae bacterium]
MDTFETTVVRMRRLQMDAQSRDAARQRIEAAVRERDAASIAAAKAAPSAATLKKAAETEQNAGLVSATSPGVSGSLGSSGGAKKAKPTPRGTVRCRDLTQVPVAAAPRACEGHGGVAATKP